MLKRYYSAASLTELAAAMEAVADEFYSSPIGTAEPLITVVNVREGYQVIVTPR